MGNCIKKKQKQKDKAEGSQQKNEGSNAQLGPHNEACDDTFDKPGTAEQKDGIIDLKNCHPNSDISRLKRSFGECKSIEFNEDDDQEMPIGLGFGFPSSDSNAISIQDQSLDEEE